jgi:predicted N-formylglutamate amidohydrolase
LAEPQPNHDPAGFTAPAPLVRNRQGRSSVVLVCEHACNFVPPELAGLGLDAATLNAHIAWDPGALAVAEAMSAQLDAVLVSAQVSRLVYDCNRPPSAADAMPARSEVFDVPGNVGLSQAERDERTALVYEPFRQALAAVVEGRLAGPAALVTMHSFTPVYRGVSRDVELGILCDSDERLAEAMLRLAPAHTTLDVRKNEPYGPADGVTHTLKEHGLVHGLPNVMLEIRNDLIATPSQQAAMAAMLCGLVGDAMQAVGIGALRQREEGAAR